MVTLSQLNRHIDDVHSDIEQKDEDIIKSWFKKKVEQAKQFPSVSSVFNSRFSKLDLFEGVLDDTTEDGETNNSTSTENVNNTSASTGRKDSFNSQKEKIPKIIPTTEHWQKHLGSEHCSLVLCDKKLNSRNGCINCRKCGKLFCFQHTQYQIKLNAGANHDPKNGVWSQCCETCYTSRPRYFDNSGSVLDVSSVFLAARRQKTDIHELEENRLEKRLLKLITLLTKDSKLVNGDNDNGTMLTYYKANRRRETERTVIKWQPDNDVTACPICEQKFGYTLRKHHCRLCGRVVCASLNTNCSREVPISLLLDKLCKDETNFKEEDEELEGFQRRDLQHSRSITKNRDMNLRLCKECKNTLFGRQNFKLDMSENKKPAVVAAYERLVPIRKNIDKLLARFQSLIGDGDEQSLLEAGKIRQRLIDSFRELDKAAKRMEKTETDNEEENRIKRLVVVETAHYLQTHMIPLKALPKVLKKQEEGVGNKQPEETRVEEEEDQEGEEEIQQELIVLKEQQVMIETMMAEASKKRRFDELEPLKQSLDDLQQEIDKLEKQVNLIN